MLHQLVSRYAVFLFIVTASPGAGETLDLTIEEAVTLALENNHAVIAAEHRVGAEKAAVNEARARFLPGVSGNAVYTRLDTAPYISLGKGPMSQMLPPGTPSKITMGDENIYDLSLSVQQPLFTGFALRSNLNLARHALESEKQGRRQTRNQTVYQVREAYYTLYKARETARIARESVDLMEAHVADLERMVKAGLASNNDLLKAQVQLSGTKVMRISAENSARLSECSLCTLLGISPDASISLESPFEYASASFDRVTMRETALSARPDLRQMRSAVDMAREGVSLARSEWYPKVSAVYNLNYKNPNREYDPEFYDTWTAGIVAQFNILDWGASRNSVARARLRQRAAEEGEKQVRDAVLLEVEQAGLTIRAAEERIVQARIGVGQAGENHRITSAKFHEGLVSNTELLDANTALTKARVEYATAVADHLIARAFADLATGKLDN
jgi:outer membrane protein TolC